MSNSYAPPEARRADMRRTGQRLAAAGAVLAGLGAVGVLAGLVLKAVWLGLLGGPVGALSALSLIMGLALLVIGVQKLKSARGRS